MVARLAATDRPHPNLLPQAGELLAVLEVVAVVGPSRTSADGKSQ
jgi:hypothetical protein